MTRLWLFRILRGTLVGFLIGAVVGGFETAIVLRTSVTELVNALQRLQLWGGNVLWTGGIGAVIGLVFSGAVGAVAGNSNEVETLAIETGRDPRHPWLPWVMGAALGGSLLVQVIPRAGALGGGARTFMAYALVAIAAAAFAIGMRLWLHQVDHTGRGAGVALLGLPTLLVITSSLSVSTTQAGGKGEPVPNREGVPNVLLISIDGLRADHVGSRVRTPTLRWMSRKGVVFTQATTASTADAPPAGAMLTGRHPLSSGFLADGQRLPDRDPATGRAMQTLAEKFAEEGYATGAFVSSAAMDGQASGLGRGFAVYDDGVGSRRPGAKELAVPTLRRWLASTGGRSPTGYEVLRPSAETLLRFEYWLAWHYRENFFAWVHLADPRMPFLLAEVGTDDLIDPLPGDAGRSHATRVVQLDLILSELFEALEDDGILERTLVIIVGTRGLVPGGKATVDESWTHVPLLMYGAGLEGGAKVDEQVRLIDLPATILSASGFRRSKMGDGVSLVPMLEGARGDGLHAIAVSPPRADGRCAIALRTPQWKYRRDEKGAHAWYVLPDDPKELRDRSEDFAEEVETASALLTDLLGRDVPTAVVPPADPGRAAELRALKASY